MIARNRDPRVPGRSADSAYRAPTPESGADERRGPGARLLPGLILASFALCAGAVPLRAADGKTAAAPAGAPTEIVVYASDLPKSSLSEFEFWKEAASPVGRMVGIRNHGDELDAPPENDPHVAFKVQVQSGVPYRCWIHMKVGKPLGKSEANMIYAQFAGVIGSSGREILKPGSASFLTLRGPAREGWYWVAGEQTKLAPLIRFSPGGEVTVRLQAGMEGVGFDQFLLSPARFLEKPPSDAIVKK